MALASHASVRLARFDNLRAAGKVAYPATSDVLFCEAGADWRAAGTDVASSEAFVFVLLGLHPSLAAAQRFVASGDSIAPWMGEAVERRSAVLEPFRHVGEVNHLDRLDAGPVFGDLSDPPGPTEPLVVITSFGMQKEGLDPERVQVFSNGVAAVRTAMTAVDGLHSQQAFTFPGGLEHDPITVTIWHSTAAMRAWAHGPGTHRLYLHKHRKAAMADRTSFTRYRIIQPEGTWYGQTLLSAA